MVSKSHVIRPLFQGPAIYRIKIFGRLDVSWYHHVEGMNITENRKADEGIETILVGRLSDQAALSGVLNTLYELHLPVISVDCLECA